MRRAAKVDGNHAAIVATLRAAGCTVQSLAAVGEGVPDLLVGRAGKTYLLEVKDLRQPASKRRLTGPQIRWHRRWRGRPAWVVLTPERALEAVGLAPRTQSGTPAGPVDPSDHEHPQKPAQEAE